MAPMRDEPIHALADECFNTRVILGLFVRMAVECLGGPLRDWARSFVDLGIS